MSLTYATGAVTTTLTIVGACEFISLATLRQLRSRLLEALGVLTLARIDMLFTGSGESFSMYGTICPSANVEPRELFDPRSNSTPGWSLPRGHFPQRGHRSASRFA